MGKYVGGEESRNRSLLQMKYTFEDNIHFKEKRCFGTIKAGIISTVGVIGIGSCIETAEKGKRYIVFVAVAYGEVLASLRETQERIELLRRWAEYGTYTKAERDRLYAEAGWVLVVKKPREGCAESYPCYHSWKCPVARVLKGENVP